MVPVLEAKARPQFLRGDFEVAAFMAMKDVEVRVRELAGLSNSAIGKTLMTDAFRPPKNANDPNDHGGPLWDPTADPGEAVALMELFKGAFRSTSSSRVGTSPSRNRSAPCSATPSSRFP
ncbi:TIGR02391 family protein [Streptomyces sp. NPDC051555]|uniref:TIGR02391 family protein n=1 Tax=Streptomyces sp. NPDC051555 TaxID=3365657 RepID=UPI003797C777